MLMDLYFNIPALYLHYVKNQQRVVLSGKYCPTTQDCSRKASWLLVETEGPQKPFHL